MPSAEYDPKSNRDRRTYRRYPLSIDIEYRLSSPERITQVGRGTVVNLSNDGILFEAEDAIPMDTLIELSIPWPALRQPAVQLSLHVIGKTVRVENRRVAVQINRAVFRTVAAVQ